MNDINAIISNWALIVLAVSALVVAGSYVWKFFQRPTSQQIEQVFQWLQYAVVEAEKYFGSGTGKLKLRYVYDLFLEKFNSLAKYITFEQFSELVDRALEEMRKLLDQNKSIQEYVGLESKETE